MTDQTVIRFEPHGPKETGMQTWDPIPAAALISGEPVQTGHEYFSTAEGALTAGVWDCTPFETVFEPYEVNEFMILLEGSVSIVLASGEEQTFRAGESFIIPKGLPCSWKQQEYVRKYYVIFDDPSGTPIEGMADLKPLRVDLSAPLDAITGLNAEDFETGIPEMAIRNWFTDVTQQYAVGVWDCQFMQRVPGHINRSELMYIVEGSGSIVNGDGIEFEFTAGDTFLVPVGMGYQWKSSEYVKKVFCAFTPG